MDFPQPIGTEADQMMWRYFLLLCTFHPIILAIFFHRRRLRPIATRGSPILAFVVNCCASGCSVSLAIGLCFRLSYLVYFIPAFIFQSFFFDIYVVLALTLYSSMNKQRNMTKFLDAKSSAVQKKNALFWITLMKKLVSPTFVCVILLTSFVLFAVPLVVIMMYSITNDHFERELFHNVGVLKSVLSSISFICIVIQLRIHHDAFGTKRHLLQIAKGILVAIIIYFIFREFLSDFGRPLFETLHFVPVFCGFYFAFVMGTCVPVYESFQQKINHRYQDNFESSKYKNTAGLGNDTLREFLSTKRGYEAFKEHLVEEHSSENILFWKAVETFKLHQKTHNAKSFLLSRISKNEKWSTEDVARDIFSQFLSLDAPLEVNLPSNILKHYRNDIFHEAGNMNQKLSSAQNKIKPITQALALPDAALCKPDLFDSAIDSILSLIETDSLLRFKIHHQRGKLWTEFEQQLAMTAPNGNYTNCNLTVNPSA